MSIRVSLIRLISVGEIQMRKQFSVYLISRGELADKVSWYRPAFLSRWSEVDQFLRRRAVQAGVIYDEAGDRG